MTTTHLPSTDTDENAPTTAAGATRETGAGVREDLLKYSLLGGFTLESETHAWYSAVDTVATAEDARAASTVLAELRGRSLPAVREIAALVDAGTALPEPATIAAVDTAVALLTRVRTTLTTLSPAAYGYVELKRLALATADGKHRKEQGVKISWGRRRALGKAARGLATDKRTRRATLHAALSSAVTERTAWAELAPDSTLPALPADHSFLDGAVAAVDTARTGIGELGRLLPEVDLAALPFAELSELVDRLAADEGTLYRLPTLRSLRDSLEQRGYTALLQELTDQKADPQVVTAACDRLFPANETDTRTDLVPAPRDGDSTAEAAEPEAVAEAPVEVAEAEVAEAEVAEVGEVAADASAAPADAEVIEETAAADLAEVEVEGEVVAAAEPEAVAEVVETSRTEDLIPPEAPEPQADAGVVSEVVPQDVTQAEAEVEVEPVAEPVPAGLTEKPSFTPGRPVTTYSSDQLVSVVRWLDSDGTERTDDELLRAAMKEFGFARLGPRIKEALGSAIVTVRS